VDRAELVAFVRRHEQAVLATKGPNGTPEACPVGVAVTDRAEIIFDTADDSRTLHNILAFPLVGLVVGGDDEVTVQCEGTADVLSGADRDRCLRSYFQQVPAGRERAQYEGITHVRVRPRWLRLSDRRLGPHGVQEIAVDTGLTLVHLGPTAGPAVPRIG
jgi:uncharacterized pyridoxamine 5'-phosphate oxidase family protein